MIQVDLPALDRPTKAISGTSSAGKKCNCGAVVRNLAVCSQPMAIAPADFSAAAMAGLGVGCCVGFWVTVMLVMVVIAGKPRPTL